MLSCVLNPPIRKIIISTHPHMNPKILLVYGNTASTSLPGGTHYLVQENTSPVHDRPFWRIFFFLYGKRALKLNISRRNYPLPTKLSSIESPMHCLQNAILTSGTALLFLEIIGKNTGFHQLQLGFFFLGFRKCSNPCFVVHRDFIRWPHSICC